MSEPLLFDVGPPLEKSLPTGPFIESYFVAAYMPSSKDCEGYWRIWKDLWFTREAAQKFVGTLASCWGERRIYRIGDVPRETA